MMKFTESHEWVKVEGEQGTIGITQHAQRELGEIVYVELPEVGSVIKAGEEAAVLESTKAAADVYSPITGKVTEVNESLSDASEKVGWIFKVELTNPKELDALMDSGAYNALIS
jgi:glycine cleavage system H protein